MRWTKSARLQSGAALAVALVGSLALYGRALGLAFVNDDVAHLLTLGGASFQEALLGQWAAQGSAYFRPLGSLALWALLWLSRGDPAPCYAALILLHGVNVWLLWQMARRLGGPLMGAGTALAWLLFPTHYEAVAYVAAIFHPLSTLLMLLAILALDRALGRGGWRSWGPVAALTLLAPLAHEQAATLPALLIGWQAVQRPPARWRDWLHSPTLYLGAVVLPVLLGRAWLGGALTDAISPSVANSWAGLLHLARLAAYPLAWFTGGLPGGAAAHAALGAGLAGAMVWLGWRGGWQKSALWGLGWLLVAGAPLALLIEARYLPSSPRLFYLPSIGIALLWGSLFAALAQRAAGWRRWPMRLAIGVWVALVCLGPLPYIRCAMGALERGSAVVRGLVAACRKLPPQGEATLVNIPFYMAAPCSLGGIPGAYPYDAAGVVVLPLYAEAADLVWINGGPRVALQSVSYAGYAPTWATHGPPTSALALRRALERGETVLVVQLREPPVRDLGAAWRVAQGAGADALLAPLLSPPELATSEELAEAQEIRLSWQDLELAGLQMGAAALPGEELGLSLYWRPASETALRGLEIQMRLRDRYGNILAEGAQPALAGYTAALWDPALTYASRTRLKVPGNAALGPAQVELRLVRGGRPLSPEGCAPCDDQGWVRLGETLVGRAHEVAAMAPGARSVNARWENGIRLEGWLMDGPDAAGRLEITLYWRAEQPVGEDLTVFLHLAGPDGVPLAQDDGEPVGGQFPTSQWAEGALVADSRSLQVPSGAEQPLRLLVGLYRWPSLERVWVSTPGAPAADHLLLAELGGGRR